MNELKSHRRLWIFFILVLLVYTFVVWNIGKSQSYTVEIVQRISGIEYPAPDRRFLIDLRDFDYIINQKSCRQLKMQPKFIILIHSAPRKRENRDNIRQTWGGWKLDHRVLFLLGTVDSEDLQNEIQSESDFFGDIVQGNFVDSYKNLSYKHVMAMKWATEFCPETQFIFKSDDDIFVNTPLISQFVQKLGNVTDFILCVINGGQPVVREKNTKWYVSPEEFPNDTYPVYCSGCGVLLTTDVARKLHKAAESTPYLFVDDVYVLGILREKIGARISPIGDLHMGSDKSDDMFAKKKNITDVNFYMFTYELTNQQIGQFWEVVYDYMSKGYYKKEFSMTY
ncbi:beta-1,3-galactosyltransferase 5-like isoform X2 [Phlebotomus papatasi]|uniref:beta-1,3-galactosyltransferase 5-like isoform X2 n=1 Tax=Phlebotomus papatasi TaxID=29031 RepID=UPI002483BA9F|nr:beta-1,3-galactosyltransferase 5-like isoform X2 [Phlebotomus papatasi]